MRVLPGVTLLHNFFSFSINSGLKISVCIKRRVNIDISHVTWGSDQDVFASDSEKTANEAFFENGFLLGHQFVEKEVSFVHVWWFPLKIDFL